jgi:hypothetical protein
VHVAASDAATEGAVPVILNNHEATATRAGTRGLGNDHAGPPLRAEWRTGIPPVEACHLTPPRLADGFGSWRLTRPLSRIHPTKLGPPVDRRIADDQLGGRLRAVTLFVSWVAYE